MSRTMFRFFILLVITAVVVTASVIYNRNRSTVDEEIKEETSEFFSFFKPIKDKEVKITDMDPKNLDPGFFMKVVITIKDFFKIIFSVTVKFFKLVFFNILDRIFHFIVSSILVLLLGFLIYLLCAIETGKLNDNVFSNFFSFLEFYFYAIGEKIIAVFSLLLILNSKITELKNWVYGDTAV